MMRPLRVVITADPDLPVPPRLYGGIERVIALLVDGLVARGHDVTLLAHRDSVVRGILIPYASAGRGTRATMVNTAAIVRSVLGRRPDVVHSFARLATLAPLLPWPVRKVMSYQRAITPRSVEWGRRLGRGTLTFVSCSRRMLDGLPNPRGWRVIYNAVDLGAFAFVPSIAADAPLVFLGRIEHIKGAHVAIGVARRANRRLILAGNVPAGHQDYFDRSIRPHVDGDRVSYVGPVDDPAKRRILGGAAALLMPILWEEPFGIVMAEALACGTPVIGLSRGAVPEVIDHGRTGFVCRDEAEMVSAVEAVRTLDRHACRNAAEQRFSQRALVDAYEALYDELAARRVPAPAGASLDGRHALDRNR